jgi:hypothetical protein
MQHYIFKGTNSIAESHTLPPMLVPCVRARRHRFPPKASQSPKSRSHWRGPHVRDRNLCKDDQDSTPRPS